MTDYICQKCQKGVRVPVDWALVLKDKVEKSMSLAQLAYKYKRHRQSIYLGLKRLRAKRYQERAV